MARYLLRRVTLMAIVLFALTFVTFLLVQIVPGDPARTAAGRTATPEQIEAERVALGLDKPVLVQYVRYLGRLAHGDLGTSVFTFRPIAADLADVLPSSIELVLAAMTLNMLIAVPLGVLAAYHGGSADVAARLLVMLGISMPVFWLGLVLQVVLGARLGWFPITGSIDIGLDAGRRITGMLLIDTALQGKWPAFLSATHHLILPAITLCAAHIAVITRTIRSNMITALNQDFINLARAKGMSERRVVLRHALPNALVPSITILGMQIGWMLGFTVLVESVFARTGIGFYAVTAVLQADLLAVEAVVLVIGAVFVGMNFVVDLIQFRLNPRLRPGLAQ